MRCWAVLRNSSILLIYPVSFTSSALHLILFGELISVSLTSLLPNLYFERVDWLATALKEAGVTVTGEQVIEIQDTLFSAYLEEIWFGKLKIETDADFMLPPLFEMRLDSKERKAVIASIDELLSVDSTAE